MTGLALYDHANNRLEVTRKGDTMKRYVPCAGQMTDGTTMPYLMAPRLFEGA